MRTPDRLVVIGASAGGFRALMDLIGALPADFAAPVCVVLHIGPHASILPELMQGRGALPAIQPSDGQPLLRGMVYIAPPDRHLMVDDTKVHLSYGAKENHTRPAIDPLFRTAAAHWRERAIGVILSGQLDDGVAGLRAIADCGGVTIVQDPSTAPQPEMPLNALAAVDADSVLPIEGIAAELERLVAAPPPPPGAAPERLLRESAAYRGEDMKDLAAVADPSTFTCPECGGVLWQLHDRIPLRYRCHTGHAYSSATLERTQSDTAQEALWAALRSLHEKELMLRRLATVTEVTGDPNRAAIGREKADGVRLQIDELRKLIEGEARA